MIDYDSLSDRELLIALNRKVDKFTAKVEKMEESFTDMAREIGPVVDGMRSGGVAGLVRALF